MSYQHRIPRRPVVDRTPAVLRSSSKGISNRQSDIGLSVLMLTTPMVLFSATLLGLVFSYRVSTKNVAFENLRLGGTEDEAGVYYVNLSSTFLIFIASWSSSLAPALVGFALTLSSYPVARQLRLRVRAKDVRQLPTPYQTALTLRFLNGGGLGALWSWTKYLFTWKKRRQNQAPTLSKLASVTICASFLGLIVFLADTWLHVTTKSVNLLQVTPVTDEIDYSFALSPGCTFTNESAPDAALKDCSIDQAGDNVYLNNAPVSLQVLNNVSESMIILTYKNKYTYIGVPPTEKVSQRDYTATTFGMETQCRPVSNECNLNGYGGAETGFHCSDVFWGDLTAPVEAGVDPNWYLEFFTDSNMTFLTSYGGVKNPFYFGLAALANNHGYDWTGEQDPQIITPIHGGIAFVLLCNSTLYNVEYDSVNGSLTRFVVAASNASVANLWQGPIDATGFGTDQLKQAVDLATLSETSQELADKIALAFSRVALAVGTGIVVPRLAVAVQERTTSLVTRVAAAPLFTLVAANLAFVLVGVVLALFALGSVDEETQEVQARLSIAGLIADHFEGQRARSKVDDMDKLFEEYDGVGSTRVAIDGALEGWYEYKRYSIEI